MQVNFDVALAAEVARPGHPTPFSLFSQGGHEVKLLPRQILIFNSTNWLTKVYPFFNDLKSKTFMFKYDSVVLV